MFGRKRRYEALSPEQLKEAASLILAEIELRQAMGPVEREIETLTQYGWTIEHMRQAFRALARAVDAKADK